MLKRQWLKFLLVLGATIIFLCLPVVIQKAPRIPKKAAELSRVVQHSINSFTWSLKPSTSVTMGKDIQGFPLSTLRISTTNGPLQVSSTNPRYFTNKDGKAVYLTGAHTWANFQDNGFTDPPPPFDYEKYLDFLIQNNHNFFRLWTSENGKWITETTKEYWFSPMPFERTGPGNALDSKPKYDLTKLNQSYFDRLRQRVIDAQKRGIYVSIMLFNGWCIEDKKLSDSPLTITPGNPWHGHPFHRDNNVNGIDGDPNNNERGEETHTLQIPAVLAIQEAYVKKVIDTVNDLDNVLYEVSNESPLGSYKWQYQIVKLIKQYEATKAKQHPVGMTSEYPDGNNLNLLDSPADWISPNGDVNERPVAEGKKVVVGDTDHLCGVCGDHQWVWKSLTRGENPLFMDYYDGSTFIAAPMPNDPLNYEPWVKTRRNLGFALTYANRINLLASAPRPDLASTGYCLANLSTSGAEYLIYSPSGGAIKVDLASTNGNLAVEWFNPSNGLVMNGLAVTSGGYRTFIPPFEGDAILYLRSI